MNQKIGQKKQQEEIHQQVQLIYDEKVVPNISKIQAIFLQARKDAMEEVGLIEENEGDINLIRAFAQGWGHCSIMEMTTVMDASGLSPQLQMSILANHIKRIEIVSAGPPEEGGRPKPVQAAHMPDGSLQTKGGLILPGHMSKKH